MKENENFDKTTIEKIMTLGSGLCNAIGSDINLSEAMDFRDDDGVLRCKVCGEAREVLRDVPYLGKRLVPRSCKCMDEMWRRKDEEKRLREEQAAVDRLFRFSLTDNRFKISTFENFIVNQYNAQHLRRAKNYVAHFEEMFSRNKGLFFFGPSSTGKTFTASCIANALMKKRVPVLVTSIRRLTSSSNPFQKGTEAFYQMLRGMESARLLVLEDVGAERDTSYMLEQVFEVIDARCGAMRPLVATSNLTINELYEEPDREKRRIYERILEMCHLVEFTGSSWRAQKNEDDYDEIENILLGEE